MPEEKEFDDRLRGELGGMRIPRPDDGFEKRIIMAAMAQQTAAETPVSIHRGKRFAAWWGASDGVNRTKVAMVAAFALIGVIVINEDRLPFAQPSEQQIAQERYTVDGIGLLADVDVAEMDMAADGDDYDLVFASF